MSTAKKKVIQCPFCSSNGQKVYLGKITGEGTIEMRRFANLNILFESDNFRVRCGVCGKVGLIHNQDGDFYITVEGTIPLKI